MKLIAALLALFLLGCVLWGIQAGVSAIARGITRIARRPPDAPPRDYSPGLPPEPAQVQTPPSPEHGAPVDWTAQLHSLFTLHQQGALTREEFEQAKQRLLAANDPPGPAPHRTQPPHHSFQAQP